MTSSPAWRCNYLWTHLTLNSDGHYKPCCRSTMPTEIRPIGQTRFIDVMNSPAFKATRLQMNQGQIPSGCVKCQLEEKASGLSLRQKTLIDPLLQNESAALTVNENEIVFVEWFLGRECNLRCLTCDPDSSSSWIQDAKLLDYYVSPRKSFDLEPLLHQLPGLRRLKLLGGEPFLTKQFETIVDAVHEQNLAKNIELVLSTNATQFPADDLLKKMLAFDFVQVSLSLDGVGELNEYVRFPSKWAEVSQNIKRYFDLYMENDHFDIVLVCTVSAYNIFGLPAIFQWWNELISTDFDRLISPPVLNMVLFPESMCASILPRDLLELAIANLAAIDFRAAQKLYKMTENSTSRPELLQKFISDTRRLDKARGRDVTCSIPELRNLFTTPANPVMAGLPD